MALSQSEYNKRWYAKNKQRAAEKRDNWRASNPDKYREQIIRESKRLSVIRKDEEIRAELNKKEREKYHRTKHSKRKELLLSSAKRRATVKNLPFNLTLDDIVIPDRCPVFGFTLEHNEGSYGGKYNSPTLDRIIPSLGYVTGNVRVLSKKANAMKHDASPEELLTFAKWIITTMDPEKA